MTPPGLKFGYNEGIPDGVETAWGCRAIVTQGGQVDVVWDRTDAAGPTEERAKLLAYLDEVGFVWQDRASELLRSGLMSTREARAPTGVGNSRPSFGCVQ